MAGNISKVPRYVEGVVGPQGDKGPQGEQGVKGDTPSIRFEYNQDTGELWYSSDGIMISKDYIGTLDIATKDYVIAKILELSNKVAPSPASVTLYADRWEQDAGETMWHQEVVVANATITPYSKVDLQLNAEQIAIFYEKDLAFVAENVTKDGKSVVTVYCIGRKPENDYVIQATVSEVVVNG